jgi:hypothetical protein
MSVTRSQILQKLWISPSECSLTDHQKELVEKLDPTIDFKIVGDIGSGKTFCVRHLLHSNKISFAYIPASELLPSIIDEEISEEVADTEVVIVDNFDTIPKERIHLDRIHKNIEDIVDSFTQSLWLILPTGYNHDWFETVISGMQSAKIRNRQINQITIDHTLSNLQKVVDGPSSRPAMQDDPASSYGYHTIINSFVAANSKS